MSSSDRRAVLGLILALGACGYAPAFAPGGPATPLLEGVKADPPADRAGFDFVQRIEERLGRTRTPRFRLTYAIATDEAGLAITPENAITRYHVTGRVDWSLRDAGSDAVLASGSETAFAAFAASGTTVSTAAARQDAYLRLVRSLADRVVTQLVAASAVTAASGDPG